MNYSTGETPQIDDVVEAYGIRVGLVTAVGDDCVAVATAGDGVVLEPVIVPSGLRLLYRRPEE